MKKVVLISLFVLFISGTSAFGYQVTGRVLYYDGNSVSDASVTINCYPSSGGSLNDSDTSGPGGGYSGGWDLTDCVGERIVVKAVKGIYSGTVSWIAQANVEVKNVTVYLSLHATAELHCEPEPVPMSEPTAEPSTVFLYVQLVSGPVLVNGGTVDMHYETETMSCSTVAPMPPFDASFTYAIDPTTGTIHVEAYAPPGLYTPADNGENPTPFFALILEPRDFNTPGKISSVQLIGSEIDTDFGIVSAFPSQTDYVIGEPNETCEPYFRIADRAEWEEAISGGHVYPMEPADWDYYNFQWQEYVIEGEPYPNDVFIPATLYVYDGNGEGGQDPNDAGLVMAWGSEGADTNSSSAWKFDYKKDPDLSNCTITLVVTAPQMGVNGQINKISFGLQNPPVPGGAIRSWDWNCPNPIPWNTPTKITIDTSKTGVNAATPAASAYASNPGFNLQNVQWLIVDENGSWVGGPNPAPGPGGFAFLWNYWHWILISPNATVSKEIYKKWSQPPVILDANDPPIFLGWNEYSDYNDPNIVADDWRCTDNRPVTDIHWWGSFIGWNNPWPPTVMPQAFHLGIWTDVPDTDPCDPLTFSHPGYLIWENYCDNYVWNFAGYDYDPRVAAPHDPCAPIEPTETCFQFTQLLSQDEWFYQEPGDPCDPNGTIYWLSIAPIWPIDPPPFEWGWKTRPHFFQDDAVSMQAAPWHPPIVGVTNWVSGIPIQFPPYPDPEGVTWDMAFELTTFEPAYKDEPIPGDLNGDKIVNFYDVAILANNWLVAAP